MKAKIIGRVYLGEKGDEEYITEFESPYEAIKANYQLWCATGEDYILSYRNNILKFDDKKSFEECTKELEYQIDMITRDYIDSDCVL